MQAKLAWRQAIVGEEGLCDAVNLLIESLVKFASEERALSGEPTVQITPLPHGQWSRYHILVTVLYSVAVVKPTFGGA